MFKDIKKIMIDFDCTIVDTIKAIVDNYNEDFQYYKDFHHINWWEINTWDFEECDCASKEYLNTYFNQPRFFAKLEMMPWAERVINELKEYYQIEIVTMGYSPNLKQKKIWVGKYFPEIPLLTVNMKKHNDKSHIDMSDSIFIDDSYKNLATSNAKEKICFGDKYSWNEQWEGKRLLNWMEVRDYLL